MKHIEALRARLDDDLRDVKLNLEAVLQPGGALNDGQRWGTALACAFAARRPELAEALVADARAAGLSPAVEADARAAAALMAMNNVYYRFRHFTSDKGYSKLPARLRMTRLAKPATSQIEFELFSLAVSAINGCETCVKAHEAAVRHGGLSEDAVHDAVRIAAVVQSAAVALEVSSLEAEASF
jgi:alkyl hydroperoxide reductase subunit D